MTEFVAVKGSSMLDVCLNTYGTFDLLAKLIKDNNVDGVNYRPKVLRLA
jgi:hypothetical protein